MGKKVGLVDVAKSPSLHVLFGMDKLDFTLTDYLLGECSIENVVYDVTDQLKQVTIEQMQVGQLILVPAETNIRELKRKFPDGYDHDRLGAAYSDLGAAFELDVLVVDTTGGLDDYALLTTGIADALVIVLRPDVQDLEGTSVLLEIAHNLNAAHPYLVINEVPKGYDIRDLINELEEKFNCRVAAVIPHSEELMALFSETIFPLRYPSHEITRTLRQLASNLIGENLK
jgi:MinD-like ATPase involved in chromosome partitioning or flagellar assembly